MLFPNTLVAWQSSDVGYDWKEIDESNSVFTNKFLFWCPNPKDYDHIYNILYLDDALKGTCERKNHVHEV